MELKRAKVIHLSTGKNLKRGLYWYEKNNVFEMNYKNQSKYKEEPKHQHLYFITDDEIKEGDWAYDTITNHIVIWSSKIISCKKIVSSTDSNLKYLTETEEDYDPETGGLGYQTIPQPSQAFIEKYCKVGGIDEVMIELEGGCCGRCIEGLDECTPTEIKIKIDSSNTITIHPIKDSWNREEVEELCKSAFNDGLSEGHHG